LYSKCSLYIQPVSKGKLNFLLMLRPNTSGLQPRAVQGMLDFDFICKRTTPSVAGIIYTFGGQFVSKMLVPFELIDSKPDMVSS